MLHVRPFRMSRRADGAPPRRAAAIYLKRGAHAPFTRHFFFASLYANCRPIAHDADADATAAFCLALRRLIYAPAPP